MDSKTARQRVLKADRVQNQRFGDRPTKERFNSRMSPSDIRKYAWPDPRGRALLARAMEGGQLTARGHDRVLRVARTLADLGDAEEVKYEHVFEAIVLRQGARDLDESS